jgi:hypothetical protein
MTEHCAFTNDYPAFAKMGIFMYVVIISMIVAVCWVVLAFPAGLFWRKHWKANSAAFATLELAMDNHAHPEVCVLLVLFMTIDIAICITAHTPHTPCQRAPSPLRTPLATGDGVATRRLATLVAVAKSSACEQTRHVTRAA